MKLFGPRYPEEIAKRIPPGQRLVKTWPVLHFGPIPDFEESTWNLEVNGLVDNPLSLTYAELKELGPVDVEADMHCVTGWSTLDNTWTGVPFRVLAEKAGVVRSAAYEVIASSAVAAPFVLYKRAAYENPDDTPVAFALDLVAKDLDLAATLAARVGADVPQLVTNRALVQRAIDAGLGQADLSALATLLR